MIEYVHYGCHTCAPETWRNFDASPTLRLQRIPLIGGYFSRSDRHPSFPSTVEYGDIVRGLPVSEDSCAAAYCSHVLEHLALEDCRKALANTNRFLRPGGIFRFVMPDLKALARTYLDDSTSDASIRFMKRSYLGKEVRARSVGDFLRSWLGNSEHLWMWDFDSMQAELKRVGFRDIRPARYGDSADPRFDDVEDENRWFQPGLDGSQVPCLGIECRK